MERLFISVVTREFASTRRLIEPIIRNLGYEPVSMDNWSTAEGELLAWIRQKIEECVGTIHLPGVAYGAEPPSFDHEANGFHPSAQIPERYSYTQFELLYVRQLGKKIWVIQPGPNCERDTPTDQLDLDDSLPTIEAQRKQTEKRALQVTYLEFLEDCNLVRHQPQGSKDLQLLIHALRDLPAEFQNRFGAWQNAVSDRVDRIQKRQKNILFVSTTSATLLAIAVIILMFLRRDVSLHTDQLSETETTLSEGQERLAKQIEELQKAYLETAQNKDPSSPTLSSWPREQLAAELAKRMEITIEDLRKLIDSGRQSLDTLVQAQALLASGESDLADQKFEEVIAKEEATEAESKRRLIQAYKGKAQIHYDKGEYQLALDSHRAVKKRTDPSADQQTWADIISNEARALFHLAKYDEAEPLMREALKIDLNSYGPEHPKVAIRLNNLAQLLQATNRMQDAEPLMREALHIDRKSFGPQHPNVATGLNNLGLLLKSTNRMQEAEPLMREALEIIASFTVDTKHIHPHLQLMTRNYWEILKLIESDSAKTNERLFSLGPDVGW